MMKSEIRTKKGAKTRQKLARKKAFALFVKSLQCAKDKQKWTCCRNNFTDLMTVHKHVAMVHRDEIDKTANDMIQDLEVTRHTETRIETAKSTDKQHRSKEGTGQAGCSESALLNLFPSQGELEELSDGEGRILLYYKYTQVDNPPQVRDWQEELCTRLKLTGKIRIACEGLNGTVGGTTQATQLYIKYTRLCPLFADMTLEDFKTSAGRRDDFPDGLRVTVHREIVPMGIDPQQLSHQQAGKHLTVDEFHHVVQRLDSEDNQDTVLVDCRNFYESKIGQFSSALVPNIRKFSYWPEYVDKNLHVFQDKKVLMYCTGGIRCERGSAYLRSKGVCKDVLQLKGGIHKYIEKYPNGNFRGKLFVFDNRYAISSNPEVISECSYCGIAWDQYEPCTSKHCHQLVLSCMTCRQRGRTACCEACQTSSRYQVYSEREYGTEDKGMREECLCTRLRERIPLETSQIDFTDS